MNVEFWQILIILRTNVSIYILIGKLKYNLKIYELVIILFEVLPICCIIDSKYFCVHAGISPTLNTLCNFFTNFKKKCRKSADFVRFQRKELYVTYFGVIPQIKIKNNGLLTPWGHAHIFTLEIMLLISWKKIIYRWSFGDMRSNFKATSICSLENRIRKMFWLFSQLRTIVINTTI